MSVNSGYAIALHDLACETKNEKEYHNDARSIVKALESNPEFIELISTTKISKEKRKTIIVDSFKGEVNDNFVNAMQLMVDNNQFNIALANFKTLNKMFNKHFNIIQGKVTTVSPLGEDEMKQIEIKMEKITGKDIELINIIDKEIIGGIRVELNDKVYDSTIKGQLEDMKLKLLKEAV